MPGKRKAPARPTTNGKGKAPLKKQRRRELFPFRCAGRRIRLTLSMGAEGPRVEVEYEHENEDRVMAVSAADW